MIHLLDKATIDKIAAGEVIERPSSVVKELLENSIDAGATNITVEIKEGGMSFIRVTDNGWGIPKEEVRTAYMRHATSKIENADDLNSLISLGFRGEALSTIAAVSQTEMITKTADSLVGTKYVIHGGTEVEYTEVGVPDGTTIVVRNLFYNTPARKKFLKTAMTEGSYINDLVQRIALSHPEIGFKLIVNGQGKLDTSGNGKVKDVIYQLFGRDITSNLIEIKHESEEISIHGYIGKPYISRGNRGLENYFINNRYIRSNIVNRAIEEGYKTFVMQHKFPFTVLYIDLPTDKCDVNVHPTKMEFKYDNERFLFEVMTRVVREALEHKEIIPKETADTTKEKIEAKKQEQQLRASMPKPAEPFEAKRREVVQQTPSANFRAGKYSPTYKILESLKKAEELEKQGVPDSTDSVIQAKKNDVSISSEKTSKDTVQDTNQDTNQESNIALNLLKDEDVIYESSVNGNTKNTDIKNPITNIEENKNNNTSINNIENNKIIPKNNNPALVAYAITGKQESLFDDDFLTENARKKHRVIGQFFGTYWLIEYEKNLYIMDQHAAHEKVNYERLMKNFASKQIFSQQLMPPMVITVSYSERQAILDHYDLFMKIGYDIEEFGGNEFKINAVPSNLYGLHGRDMFMEFVSSLMENVGYMSNDIFIKKLATMACKAAIKGNMHITVQEADALIDELLKLDNPYTCPHGRPTIISISEKELEKKFKRIVD